MDFCGRGCTHWDRNPIGCEGHPAKRRGLITGSRML
jgi:hypothetical protein